MPSNKGIDYNNFLMLIVGGIMLILAIYGKSKATQKRRAIIHLSGREMKHIQGDTRIRRFSHGEELSKEGFATAQGDPYIVFNGNNIEVVICKPEHLQEFQRGDSKDHSKATDGNMGYFFHQFLGQCLGAQSGETWRQIRTAFDPYFTAAAARQFESIFRTEITAWMQSLPHAGSNTFTLNTTAMLNHLPFKLIAYSLYGNILNSVYPDLMILTHMREELGSIAFFGTNVTSHLYRMLPTAANRLLAKYIKGFREFNLRIIHQASKENNTACPIYHIFKAFRPANELDLQRFLHSVDEVLFENIDVAGSALMCLLLNVGHDAAVQEELREEISRSLGEQGSQGLEHYLTRSDTMLEYACVESRRLCPVTWFTFCERASKDKIIGGYHIPAGTDVMVDCRSVNFNSPIWNSATTQGGADPVCGDRYAPGRFRHLKRIQYRYSMVGYGVGFRKCIGQNFANLTMKLFLAEVLSSYHVRAPMSPYDAGFREDKFVLLPKGHDITFEKIGTKF